MKIVVQRVKKASVSVQGNVVGKIDAGALVLVGFSKNDTMENCERLAKKLVQLRIYKSNNNDIDRALDECEKLLIVSQFTLLADTSGGNRPSFINALSPDEAREYYQNFVELVTKQRVKVETGIFGEYMTIEATLDGPVTIELSS